MLFEYANVLFGLLFGAAFVVLNISVLNPILAVGLVYVWRKGDLDWVKSTLASQRLEEAEGAARAAKPEAQR